MIFVSESDVYFQTRCRLELLLPYGLMLTKTKTRGPWTLVSGCPLQWCDKWHFLQTYFIVTYAY